MPLIDMLFNHIWTVSRKSRAADGQGGFTWTWATSSSIVGRMRPATATERTVAQQLQAEISHVFYCDADEDIARGDRVTGDGATWDVIAIREPSRAGHHLEVDCLQTQIGGQP